MAFGFTKGFEPSLGLINPNSLDKKFNLSQTKSIPGWLYLNNELKNLLST